MPGLDLVQVLFLQAWHCRAGNSSPLESENKIFPPKVNSYPVDPLGRWPHGQRRGPGGPGRDPGQGHTDLWPQSGQILSNTCTHTLSGIPQCSATPAFILETRSLTPALWGALWQRLHRTLAASHTPHTRSLLNPHPTSRPPEVQTFTDPPFQTPGP